MLKNTTFKLLASVRSTLKAFDNTFIKPIDQLPVSKGVIHATVVIVFFIGMSYVVGKFLDYSIINTPANKLEISQGE